MMGFLTGTETKRSARTARASWAIALAALAPSACSAPEVLAEEMSSQASTGASACVIADEHEVASLGCTPGETISSVEFAAYGTPGGTCGNFSMGECNSVEALAIVRAACLNKATCTVPADNSIFGDPCYGVFKRLVTQVSCSAPNSPADPGTVIPPGPVVPSPVGNPGTFCPANQTCRILSLGDSITYGIGSTANGGYRIQLTRRILRDNKNATLIGTQSSGPDSIDGTPFNKQNEGYPGYRIDEIDIGSSRGFNLSAMLQTSQPNIILLHIGTNDIIQGTYGPPAPNLTMAPQRLQTLIGHISQIAPNALIVVAQLAPLTFDWGKGDASVVSYNSGVAQVVKSEVGAGKHVVMVDMHSVVQPSQLGDEIHPNDAGYAAMGDVWYGAIANYLP